MSRNRRDNITRRNRQKQWAKEQLMWRTNGRQMRPGFLPNGVGKRLKLFASRAGDPVVYYAAYRKTQAGAWKIYYTDPQVQFLRFCGPKDAPTALKKRGFDWAWNRRPSRSSEGTPNPTAGPGASPQSVSTPWTDRPGPPAHADPQLQPAAFPVFAPGTGAAESAGKATERLSEHDRDER
jgi:hypothetical protein